MSTLEKVVLWFVVISCWIGTANDYVFRQRIKLLEQDVQQLQQQVNK